MTAAPFAAELALRATLLIGLVWAAAAMLRKAGASAAARHIVWLLGIAALLALPLCWWLTPPLELPVLRPEAPIAATAALAPPAVSAPQMTAATPGWGNALLVAYLLGAALVLLRFALCRRMVSSLWRDAEPADAAWRDLLASVSRELRLSRPLELRIARGPAMPMTWGTLAPKVLLPAEARGWSPDRRRLVLLHELAHVARGDSLSRSAASLACALYWFHPGAWFAARRMRMEQEYAADDRVLTTGASARTYAASLLDLAWRVGERSRPDHAAAMAGMCQLEHRLVSITAPVHRDRPGPAFLSASAAIATLVTLGVAAGVLVRPPSSLPDPLGSGTDSFAMRADPVPDQGGPDSAALAPRRANPAPRGEDPARNLRDGLEGSGSTIPPSPAEGPVLEAGGQRAEPAAQGHATEPFQDRPAAPPQLASYGPQLPQPLAEEQASDPRIPAALRRGNAERGASQSNRPAASRSRSSAVLRILPRMILESSGILPPT
jgi:beta-lactamase regulating signal transducer with metallopeptidase domain